MRELLLHCWRAPEPALAVGSQYGIAARLHSDFRHEGTVGYVTDTLLAAAVLLSRVGLPDAYDSPKANASATLRLAPQRLGAGDATNAAVVHHDRRERPAVPPCVRRSAFRRWRPLFLADAYASQTLQSSGPQRRIQGADPLRVPAARRVGFGLGHRTRHQCQFRAQVAPGRGLKRMGAEGPARGSKAALQFAPVELPRSEPVVAARATHIDIRIELQRGGPHVKLQCAASAGALYAAQLRALADALCAA